MTRCSTFGTYPAGSLPQIYTENEEPFISPGTDALGGKESKVISEDMTIGLNLRRCHSPPPPRGTEDRYHILAEDCDTGKKFLLKSDHPSVPQKLRDFFNGES